MKSPRPTSKLRGQLARQLESPPALLLDLGEWLDHLSIFSELEILQLLNHLRPAVEHFLGNTTKNTSSVVTVCDHRWVTAMGNPEFYDVRVGDVVPVLPFRPVTHFCCDLEGLQEKKQNESSRTVGEPQPGAVDESDEDSQQSSK